MQDVPQENPGTSQSHADQLNLILLSDAETLRDWGLSEAEAGDLEKTTPKTRLVSAGDEASLWNHRRKLFFKPVAGHRSSLLRSKLHYP